MHHCEYTRFSANALSVCPVAVLLTIVASEVLMDGLFAINFDWRIISSRVWTNFTSVALTVDLSPFTCGQRPTCRALGKWQLPLIALRRRHHTSTSFIPPSMFRGKHNHPTQKDQRTIPLSLHPLDILAYCFYIVTAIAQTWTISRRHW